MDSTPALCRPGFTALHDALLCENNNDDTIKTLLDEGASPAACTPQGDTPLHLTLISKRYLMELGENVVTLIDDRLFQLEENPFGSNGFSHCHIACMFGKLEIVRSFLDRGLDPNMHRVRGPFLMERHRHLWDGDTCLHVATYAGRCDVVKLLLERGADPNARNVSLRTSLHNAMYDVIGSATKLLLEHGADVNARDCDDMTPLHLQFSIFHWEYDVVKALIEAGADVNLVNRFGFTALHSAITTSGNEITDIYTWMLLIEHVLSLKEAGLDLSDENLKHILKVKKIFKGYRKDCRHELKRMNCVRLDARTTLRDALSIRDPRRLQRLTVNEKFKRIVAEEAALGRNEKFPIYGPLVRLQYRRGARIAEAVLALQTLYANAYMTTDNASGLPQECAEMVLYYLTYEELWRVTQTALQ